MTTLIAPRNAAKFDGTAIGLKTGRDSSPSAPGAHPYAPAAASTTPSHAATAARGSSDAKPGSAQ